MTTQPAVLTAGSSLTASMSTGNLLALGNDFATQQQQQQQQGGGGEEERAEGEGEVENAQSE